MAGHTDMLTWTQILVSIRAYSPLIPFTVFASTAAMTRRILCIAAWLTLGAAHVDPAAASSAITGLARLGISVTLDAAGAVVVMDVAWQDPPSQIQNGTVGCFPLLPAGTRFGVSYTPSPTNGTATDGFYQQVLNKGANLLQLSLPWASVEVSPGVINVALVAGLLQSAAERGLVPLFMLAAINTNVVSVPSDLADPADPSRLAAGLTWSSPIVIYRYALAVQAIAPLVQFYGGFYFGFGNEVDVNLSGNTTAATYFPGFASVVRSYIRNITSDQLTVGATVTVGGLAYMQTNGPIPAWFEGLKGQVDAMPLTYYPLQGVYDVITNRTRMLDDVSTAVALLPPASCVVFQELGYPSGYNNASSTDGSSLAAQASFFDFALTQLLPAVNASGALRAVSVFQMVDMPPEVCFNLTKYYNVTQPAFVEYLCTLGLVANNGTAKPAFNTLLSLL